MTLTIAISIAQWEQSLFEVKENQEIGSGKCQTESIRDPLKKIFIVRESRETGPLPGGEEQKAWGQGEGFKAYDDDYDNNHYHYNHNYHH